MYLRRIVAQVATVSAIVGCIFWLGWLIHQSLAQQGIGFSFDYLRRPSGINLSEGVAIDLGGWTGSIETVGPDSSNAQVLLAGLINTLKIALLAIVFSTMLGVATGVGRLSTNWLIRKLAFWVVEFVRNTPLLIQLVFWYFAVILKFPPVTAVSRIYSWVVVSQSGIFVPWFTVSEGASSTAVWLLVGGFALAVASACPRFGRPARRCLVGFAVISLLIVMAIGFPLTTDFPQIGRFGASGGYGMTPEMSALLLAITVNSAAYTAEIVRGAIEALPKGQWEASAALGMSRRDTLGDIILPQVLRVVLPSLGNRFISLTKDTSLGIAIGYPDLFNVNGTVSNQTGRNLEGVIIVMAAYLIISWAISGTINLVNSRLVRHDARG
jgi:His/Glu/Gln/Arg/opine family amino acid ABC transporter permease subunit